jgi:ribonuclease VapC
MFIDASAVIAIVANEPDRQTLRDKMSAASHAITSPLAIYEATLGLTRIASGDFLAASHSMEEFLRDVSATVVDIDAKIAKGALDAFIRFGKGRHRAALNMGDCFSYACAKIHRVPLLCKGDDFIHTDIRIA